MASPAIRNVNKKEGSQETALLGSKSGDLNQSVNEEFWKTVIPSELSKSAFSKRDRTKKLA